MCVVLGQILRNGWMLQVIAQNVVCAHWTAVLLLGFVNLWLTCAWSLLEKREADDTPPQRIATHWCEILVLL